MKVWLAIFEGIDEHEVVGIYSTVEAAKRANELRCGGFLRDYYAERPYELDAQPLVTPTQTV